MNKKDLDKIIELHKMWLNGDKEGVRADLSGANLRWADLSGANLSGANISLAEGKVVCSTSGIQGERGRMITLLAEGKESEWKIWCGCFNGTRSDLKKWLDSHNRAGWERESTEMCIKFLFSLARKKIKSDDQNERY